MSTLSQAALRNTTSVTKNVSSKLLGSTRTMASGKEIRFGVEGRAAMLRGVDLLADAVQVSFETPDYTVYIRQYLSFISLTST